MVIPRVIITSPSVVELESMGADLKAEVEVDTPAVSSKGEVANPIHQNETPLPSPNDGLARELLMGTTFPEDWLAEPELIPTPSNSCPEASLATPRKETATSNGEENLELSPISTEPRFNHTRSTYSAEDARVGLWTRH
jgi:hypothetical protein